jgi:hypothetical protein
MSRTCPACLNVTVSRTTIISRNSTPIIINFCKNCGHGVQTKETDYDIYSSGKFSEVARDNASIPSPEKVKELDKMAFKRFRFYKKYFFNVKSALEVGSSIGSFVHLMKLSGIKCEGIEPDPNYAGFSNSQYGFDQKSLLFENYSPSNKYDLVYSFHVIEHVPDIQSYVENAYKLLAENGKILIECPSWDLHSFGDKNFTIWEPHLQYFTQSSLYTLLSTNRFKVLDIGFVGTALFAIASKEGIPTFSQSVFFKFKRRYQLAFNLSKYFPKLPFSIKGTSISNLILQYTFAKNNRSLRELAFFAKFAAKNRFYLIKEHRLSKRKASHVSYFSGWENAGDTVLSKCTRDAFNRHFNNGWNLIKVTEPVDEQLIAQINCSKYLLIGGGGLLLPDSNPNALSGWQWAIKPEFWSHIRVPVIVFAIGYNFFKGQNNSDLFTENLVKLVEISDFFSLRNHGSIKKVNQLLPEHLQEKVVMQPCPTTIIRNLHPYLPKKKASKIVGINIAYDRYERRFGKDIYLILDQLALAMRSIQEFGYEVINVCHLEDDNKFAISLTKRGVRFHTVNLQYMLPSQVFKFYNEIEVMIGARGHAQMIPFGLNTKIISIGTHDKIRYFLDDIDSMDWYVDAHERPQNLSERLLKVFTQIMNSSDAIQSRLLEQQERLYKINQLNLSQICRIIASNR